MTNLPVVYFIILNFNAAQETLSCVASLEQITYPYYRVIVVDNCSTDNSWEILNHSLSRHTLLRSDGNYGYAHGNNLGIQYALAQGAEYICILNNDVEAEADFLEPLIHTLASNPEVGMAGPTICDFYNRAQIQAMGASLSLYSGLAQGIAKGKPYAGIRGQMREVDYLGGACFVVKAKVLAQTGLIPENYFLFFEETELCLKAQRLGYKLVCLHASRVYHKRSATISKYQGLGYYFLNRNRVVFMRRNAGREQRIVFYIYLIIEALARILIRREPWRLYQIFYEGFKADPEKLDMDKAREYLAQSNRPGGHT
ncbi:glycosyltransferase family 2 protein [Paradesulfitobacterium ferrireducens]|uniref:glycosyltransferase family 2 protein n=1 Tax=Paradesulfitobacterium ferrireducens TaxID=2816476 RepID=UPI001A8F9E13|nr:glycosyltransferase family 2 protein [Paradesulfitobacterium ferrireducens]